MKPSSNWLKVGLSWVIVMGVFTLQTGCHKKENSIDLTPMRETAEDQSRIEAESNFISDAVDNQGEYGGSHRVAQVDSTYLPPCAQVSYDSTQRRLLINFGPTNCLCRDGVYRRGKIYVTFSGARWPLAPSRAYITTDSFYVNDNRHDVIKILVHEGLNNNGERILRDTVQQHTVTTPNGTMTWSAVRLCRQTQGQTTWVRWDDVWFIGGSSQGTNCRGNPFTTQISDSLKVVGSCIFRHPVKGIIQHNTQNHTIIVNYDPYNNEACDRVASMQIDNNAPVNITLN